MKKILYSFLLCLSLSACGHPAKYGTIPYDDSKPYIEVPSSVPYDIVSFMDKKGYKIGQFKALPLARILKYKERYNGSPRDINYIGWFTSIKTNDNKIYYVYWEDGEAKEIETVSDVLWFYFIDDSESNLIINRKKEANIINKWYWINWRE